MNVALGRGRMMALIAYPEICGVRLELWPRFSGPVA